MFFRPRDGRSYLRTARRARRQPRHRATTGSRRRPGDDELALFDLLFKENISKADRERLKQASKSLLSSLRDLLQPMQDWTQKTATQAEVEVFILNNLYEALPRPPFTEAETEEIAGRVYDYVWERSASGHDFVPA